MSHNQTCTTERLLRLKLLQVVGTILFRQCLSTLRHGLYLVAYLDDGGPATPNARTSLPMQPSCGSSNVLWLMPLTAATRTPGTLSWSSLSWMCPRTGFCLFAVVEHAHPYHAMWLRRVRPAMCQAPQAEAPRALSSGSCFLTTVGSRLTSGPLPGGIRPPCRCAGGHSMSLPCAWSTLPFSPSRHCCAPPFPLSAHPRTWP
jgi:hypothetical protein